MCRLKLFSVWSTLYIQYATNIYIYIQYIQYSTSLFFRNVSYYFGTLVLPWCSLTFHGIPWIQWHLNLLFIQFHNITKVSPYYILLGESSFHLKSGLMLWLIACLYWGISTDNSVCCVFCYILSCAGFVCARFHIHVCIDCQYIYRSDV